MYIGSSVNLKLRLYVHKHDLTKGTHRNRHLQNAWDKYKEESFEFKVLEYVMDKTTLTEREQFWIDKFNTGDNLYNICLQAENHLGVKRTKETRDKIREKAIGRKVSSETKQKMSESRTGTNNGMFGKGHSQESKEKISKGRSGKNLGTDNHFFGKHHSEEAKGKISKANKGKRTRAKLTWGSVREIRKLASEGKTDKELAELFGVYFSTIAKIRRNERWVEDNDECNNG